MISKNKQLAKTLKGNYLVATLFVTGIIIDAAYLLLCLLSDTTPFAQLPAFGKIALALPLFAVTVYTYQHLAATLTGKSKIEQLIEEASNEDKL